MKAKVEGIAVKLIRGGKRCARSADMFAVNFLKECYHIVT